MHQNSELENGHSRIEGIDLLRGLSTLFFVLSHAQISLFISRAFSPNGFPEYLISPLFWNGSSGVVIFFCISGFIIASTSIKRWGSLHQIRARDFYVFRFARIVPLFLTLLFILSCLHLANFKPFVISEEAGGLGKALLATITFRMDILRILPQNWSVLWFLPYEELFYLLFPLGCLALRRPKTIFAALALIFTAAFFTRTLFTLERSTMAVSAFVESVEAISLGVLTALIAAHIRLSRSTLLWASRMGLFLLAFSFLCGESAIKSGLISKGFETTFLEFGACLTIMAAARTGWKVPRILRPLARFGERSYEIYLTHMFVVIGSIELFFKIGKPLWTVPILFIAVVVFCGLLGEVVGRFYSMPINVFIRRSLKRRI